MLRAKELKLSTPDASILLSSVDRITEKSIKKDTRKSFRLETLREQLKVDIIPTKESVENLSKFIQAELEDAINTQLDPKIKALNIPDQKGAKGKDEAGRTVKGSPKGKTGKGKDDAKGKGRRRLPLWSNM